MIYDVTHITTYAYPAPVDLAQCILHHQPVDRRGQNVIASALHILPQPRIQTLGLDSFGNRVAHLGFAGLHRALRIEARARIKLEANVPPLSTPGWETICSVVGMDTDTSASAPIHYIFASPHVPLLAEALAFAQTSLWQLRPVLELAMDISNAIHDTFTYDPNASDVSTPVLQILRQKRGVCQDFAHVLLACLRALGLPAAYVSGYLRTLPPTGKPRLVGADASHAWVQVWCGPQAGWVGLDPTNRCLTGQDHIILAIGRDYADIAPVYGVFRTSGGQKLKVSVDVQVVG